MKYFLLVVSIVLFFTFMIIGSEAKGAIHEIEALIILLISMVFFCTAIIVRQLGKMVPTTQLEPTYLTGSTVAPESDYWKKRAKA